MSTAPFIAQPKLDTIQSPDAALGFRIGRIKVRAPLEVPGLQITHTQPVPRPARFLLGTLSDQGFRVIKPIPVEVEFREDTIITSWEAIEEFGTGASVFSSAQDLGRTIAELYRALQVDQQNLGPEMQRVWAVLQEHVVTRR